MEGKRRQSGRSERPSVVRATCRGPAARWLAGRGESVLRGVVGVHHESERNPHNPGTGTSYGTDRGVSSPITNLFPHFFPSEKIPKGQVGRCPPGLL